MEFIQTMTDREEALELYKVMVGTITANEQRRQQSATIFMSLIATGFAALGIVEDLQPIYIATATALVSVVWFLTVKYFKRLAKAKFEVIAQLEKHFAIWPFDLEWKAFNHGSKADRRKLRLTSIELIVPGMLATVSILYVLVWLATTTFVADASAAVIKSVGEGAPEGSAVMQTSFNVLLAIYGALLSTGLAVLAFAKFRRERPLVSVDATTVFTPAREGDDTHGVLIHVERGDDILCEEADVEIRIRNAGAAACQISDVFVETATEIQQVRPEGLPIILTPNTSVSVRVQPEYFVPKRPTKEGDLELTRVQAVGVFDALGKKHLISKENLASLVQQCGKWPLRTALFKHKESGNTVMAFQAKDRATILKKKPATPKDQAISH